MVPESSSLTFLPSLPIWSSILIAAAATILWWAVHATGRRSGSLFGGWRAAVAGGLVGGIALAAGLHTLQGYLVYTTRWPIWIPAVLGSLAVEGCRALYDVERRIVRRPAIRWLLTGCRFAVVLLLALMLAQPVVVIERHRTLDRYVAIILDETPSMHIADSRMSIVERLHLAEALGRPHSTRPYQIDQPRMVLKKVNDSLTAQAEWLDALQVMPDDDRERQLESERRRLHTFFKDQQETLRKALGEISAARELAATMEGPHTALTSLEARLDKSIIGPLADLTEKTRPESMPVRWIRYFREQAARRAGREHMTGERLTETETHTEPPTTHDTQRVEIGMESVYEPARRSLAAAIDALDEIDLALQSAGRAMDQAFYENLDDRARESIDRVSHQSRHELARDLLLGSPDAETDTAASGFLQRLTKTHPVKIYSLTDVVEERDLEQWRKTIAANRPTPADAQETNPQDQPAAETHDPAPVATHAIAEIVASQAPMADAERFDMLIARETGLMTQGRQTDLRSALAHVASEIPSDQFEAVILISDHRHNADGSPEGQAARYGISGIPIHPVLFGASNAPIDAAIVSVDAPDTILAGDRARFVVEVRLDGLTNRPVEIRLMNGTGIVDRQTLETDIDGERRRVELFDRPETIGMHRYRIALDFDPAEAIATNNTYQTSVNVSEEPAHLLLIEGRPSWEFRYLKNLFSGRDPWTRMQYVLLEQRMIPDEPERESTPASVSRSGKQIEANALPENLEEWLKFDVIILGDVAPEHFTEEAMAALSVFVRRRGGTLIVMAGPNSMPHAYPPGDFRDLLPIHPLSTDRALFMGPEREYKISLSREGEADPMMRLSSDPAENHEIWDAIPDIYWRQPVVSVRDGATVLAYAAGRDLPQYMREPPSDPHMLAQQSEYERSRALIVHHHAGLGNVLYFAFNHTWRLRYRTGDTFHHRLWGQIMRWATAYKMPFGTEYVRMGTGQARYSPDDAIVVRARLLKHDRRPYIVENVNAVFMRGNEMVMRREMRYIEGSPGVYEIDVTGFEEGDYAVRLEAPIDEDLMAEFNHAVADAPPSFSVMADMGSEWRDLTADAGVAGRIAALSGGRAVKPPEIDSLLSNLGPSIVKRTDREQWNLWNSWPLLVLMALLLGTEWLLRKRERLP